MGVSTTTYEAGETPTIVTHYGTPYDYQFLVKDQKSIYKQSDSKKKGKRGYL